MKKIAAVLFVMTFLVSSYVHSEEDAERLEVCTEQAKNDGVSSELAKEYIDKCVQFITDDEKNMLKELKIES